MISRCLKKWCNRRSKPTVTRINNKHGLCSTKITVLFERNIYILYSMWLKFVLDQQPAEKNREVSDDDEPYSRGFKMSSSLLSCFLTGGSATNRGIPPSITWKISDLKFVLYSNIKYACFFCFVFFFFLNLHLYKTSYK